MLSCRTRVLRLLQMRLPPDAPTRCRRCWRLYHGTAAPRVAAALGRPRQKAAHPGAVRAAGSSDRMREQKGPFSLPEITADLLPVSGKAPLEVQHVVGDLEGQPR